jgi:hypothetical protein
VQAANARKPGARRRIVRRPDALPLICGRRRQYARHLFIVRQRGRGFFQGEVVEANALAGRYPFRRRIERHFDGGDDALGRQPVALHGRRQPHDRLGLAGVDVHTNEQFRLGDSTAIGEADTAAADHDAAPSARVAPPGQPVGEGCEQGTA